MKTVLVNKPIHPVALERLSQDAHVLTPYTLPRDQMLALLPDAHAVILCAGLTVGGAEMDLATSLEVIGRHGAGMDNVDVAAASERSIPVVFTPYGPTESTAEHTLLLILAAARRLYQLDSAVRGGDFSIRNRPQAMGHEVHGMTLGVVGFGRIGQRLAEMCSTALHMPVHVYDPYVATETIIEWGATPEESLVEMAEKIDILTVHAPLTPTTHHLISREIIFALKPGAILVNVSRGPLVDEEALIEALQEGHLGSAGLDVFDPAPPRPDNPLLQMHQVVLTPHVGSFTEEGRRLMGLTVVEDILRALEGERPRFLANPEVWEKRRTVPVQRGDQ
jgi:D-3-phosphoglycerate dehydrogenase